jgi:hypothetical protein
MNLSIDEAEASALREALQTHIKQLIEEIAHADHRAYRDMLREKLARFEQLAAKVGNNGGATIAPPAH